MPYFDCYCKNNSPNCPRCYPRRHNRRDRHEDRVIYEERRRRYESPSNQSYSPVSRRQRRNVEVKEKKYVKVVPVYRKSRKPPEQIKKPHESTYSKYIKSESTTPSQVNHSYVPQILPGSTRFSQPPVNYYAPMRMPVNIPVEVPMNLVGQPQYVQPPIMQYQPVKVYPNVRARLPVVNQNQNPYVRYVSANQPVYQSNQTMSNRVPLNYTNTGYINNSPSNQRFVQYIHPQSSVRSDQYRQPNLNPYSQQVQYITNNVQPNDERSPSYFRMNQPKSVYPLNQNMYPNQHNQSQYLSGFTYPNLDTNVVGGNVNSQSINMQSNLFDATNSNSNNNNHVMQSVDSYDNLTKFNHGATNSTSRFIDTNLSQNPNVNPNLSQLIVPNVNPNVNSVMNNFQHSNQSVNPNMVSSINSSVNPNMVQNVNPNMNYINRNVSHSMTPNINSFVNSNTVQNMNQITNTAITPNMYRNLNSNFNNNNSSINQRSATNMNQNLNYNKSPTVNPNMNSSRNYNMGVNMNPNINTSFNSNVHQNINSNQNFNEDPNMNYNINSNTNSRMNQNIMNNSNSNTINRYLNMNPNLNANMNVNANQNIMSNPNSNLKQTINYSSTQMNPNMISRNLLAGNMKLQNNESILNNFSHNYQKPTNDYIDTPMDQFNKGTFDNTNTTKINNNAIITSLTKEIQSPNSKYIKTQNNDNSEETESDSSKDSSLDEKLLESLNNLNNFNQDFNSKKMYNLKNVEHQLKDVSSKLSTLKIENDMVTVSFIHVELIFNKYKDMLNIKNTIATINYNDIILESKESDKCGNSLKWSFNQKINVHVGYGQFVINILEKNKKKMKYLGGNKFINNVDRLKVQYPKVIDMDYTTKYGKVKGKINLNLEYIMNRSMKIDNVTKEFEKTDAIVDTIKYVENLQIKKDINEDDENGFLTKYNIRDNKDLENDFGVYDDVDLDEINPYADRLIEYDEEDKLFDSNSLKSSSNVVIPKDVKFNSKLYEGIECQNNRNKDDGSNKPFKHLNNSESKDEAQFENEKLSNKSLSQLEILNDEFRHHEALIDFEIPKGKEKKESESSKNFKFVDEIDYDIEKLDDENQEKVMRLCKAFPRINQKAIIIEFYNNYLDSDSTYVALQDINAD